MYYRLYASKNNTIFRHFNEAEPNAEQPWSLATNTGDNTIMELLDGRGQSTLMFGFELPEWLISKLSANEFKANFRLYDAGTVYEPALMLKELTLQHFTDDFVEGNGWSFTKDRAVAGTSNWVNRTESGLWSDVTFNNVATYQLNKNNEDLCFDVAATFEQQLSSEDAGNPKYNFALKVTNYELQKKIYGKFIYSRHTRTIFQPFIEFFIEDELQDRLHDATAGRANKIYFINENGVDFTGAVTASIVLNDGTTEVVTATNESGGVYHVSITPTEPLLISKKEYVIVTWSIGARSVFKQTVLVKPQDQFVSTVDYKNLFFYPTTPYTHNVVRQGDIIPFEVVSQIRGAGDVVQLTYEYRVVSADGFEMIPWQPVSVYRNKMYFNIDTSFFPPELSYEVFVRNNRSVEDGWSITSSSSHKFKLVTNAQSHLRELSASPYYSRSLPFAK